MLEATQGQARTKIPGDSLGQPIQVAQSPIDVEMNEEWRIKWDMHVMQNPVIQMCSHAIALGFYEHLSYWNAMHTW